MKRLALARVGPLAIRYALLRRSGFSLFNRFQLSVTPVRIAHVAKRNTCGPANAEFQGAASTF